MTMIIKEVGDNIYLNINIFNDFREKIPQVQAIYTDNRSEVILQKSSDYYMSIIRFTIPANALNIFIFSIQEGLQQNDNLLGVYSFTISFGSIETRVFLSYIPDNFSIPIPKPPSENGGKQKDSSFYFVFNYHIFVQMMNIALSSAYAPIASSFPQADAPFIIYNEETQLISIIVHKDLVSSNIDIFWNVELERFLEAIPIQLFDSFSTSGKDIRLVLENRRNNLFALQTIGTSINTTFNHFIYTMEYPIIQYWNSPQRIVITSSSLPSRLELLSSVNNDNQFSQILTDFAITSEKAGDTRSVLNFVPTTQYRLIDLLSDSQMRSLDINVGWVDIVGTVRPIFINPGSSINIKIGFFKKDLYKNTSNLLKI